MGDEDTYLLVSKKEDGLENFLAISDFIQQKVGYIRPFEYAVSADWYNRMNFCGCGCPEETMQYVTGILTAMKERSDSGWKIDKVDEALGAGKNTGIYYFIMYALDAMGLTEHGSSVGGSWLTDKGTEFLKRLQTDKLEVA